VVLWNFCALLFVCGLCCWSWWFGHTEDENCGPWCTMFLTCWPISVEQFVIRAERWMLHWLLDSLPGSWRWRCLHAAATTHHCRHHNFCLRVCANKLLLLNFWSNLICFFKTWVFWNLSYYHYWIIIIIVISGPGVHVLQLDQLLSESPTLREIPRWLPAAWGGSWLWQSDRQRLQTIRWKWLNPRGLRSMRRHC